MAVVSIKEVVRLTGVSEGTLRMWERRHGAPSPERLASGHRRYTEADVELVRRIAAARAAGLALPAAVERARAPDAATGRGSLHAALVEHRPELVRMRLAKPELLALSQAIEDESCARADRPLLFGSFQRSRFFAASRRRWRALAREARLAFVFADFERLRRPEDGPVEVPIRGEHPLSREWAIVCDAPGHAVCMAGRELPPDRERPREFEVVWSVEPDVVREATMICLELVRAAGAASATRMIEIAASASAPVSARQLQLAGAITARSLERLRAD